MDAIQQLYKEILGNAPANSVMKSILDDFFTKHTVIPRGENPHPFAGPLHHAIEGGEILIKFPSGDTYKMFPMIEIHDVEYLFQDGTDYPKQIRCEEDGA